MSILNTIKKFFAGKRILTVIILSFAAGFLLRGGGSKDVSHDAEVHDHGAASDTVAEVWTCSMHPQIRQPGPGQCPLCGMDLIPVTSDSGGGELSARELKLSPAAIKLAEIQVAPVARRKVRKEIRTVGKIAYDESQIRSITAWLPGRIDRLFVDYTGIVVRKGDHLAELYSPDLYTAQEELIQSLKAVDELKNSTLTTVRETASLTVESAREKLRLLGLNPEQITDFETKGKPSDNVTIYSPIQGVVIHKNAVEGTYVSTGSRIYTIANLTNVWAMLDIYESDLQWIRYGQEVEFHTEAYPGEKFTGKISFIDPVLNDKTRTIKIRVNVPNQDGRLKPDMFVKAVIYSNVAAGGKVIDAALSGKYICSMHPEIVKDHAGDCDVCDMPLVKAESLGYASASTTEPPLVIADSAPLITGKRAVVYVAVAGQEGVFEGREVVLGPRVGGHYIVSDGLSEGEMVVVNGNFKIDSAIQILAKPSMMNPDGGVALAGHNHGGAPAQTEHDRSDGGTASKTHTVSDVFKSQLGKLYNTYFPVQYALSHDSAGDAVKAAKEFVTALGEVDMSLLDSDAHMIWMKQLAVLQSNSELIAGADDIDASRKAFKPFSQTMIDVTRSFGTSGDGSVYRFHCPMADNNKGADWLQNKPDIENPFFGSSMFKCGDLVETIQAEK